MTASFLLKQLKLQTITDRVDVRPLPPCWSLLARLAHQTAGHPY